jgi:hypothetical protein
MGCWCTLRWVASFELVLPFLEQAQRRQDLSLSALQQRFRVPPRCPSLPDPVNPKAATRKLAHRRRRTPRAAIGLARRDRPWARSTSNLHLRPIAGPKPSPLTGQPD